MKLCLLKLLLIVLSNIGWMSSFSGFRRKLFLAILRKEDIVRWRIEKSRDIGVKIGKKCRFFSANFFSEPWLVEIGDNVIVSGEVKFLTHDGGVFLMQDEMPNLCGHYGKIKVGNNCFIGMGAIICQNVQIGDNSIIGTGAVVMDSFPSNSIIVGNPARLAFKFSMYKRMRMNSPFTLENEYYPFPLKFPHGMKKEFVMGKIDPLSIKLPKSAKKRPRQKVNE